MELTEIRKEIDGIDEELAKLFVRRMACADRVAEAKRGSGKPVLDPGREREILAKVAERVGSELENEGKLLFSTLMSISRGRQEKRLGHKTKDERRETQRITVGIRGMGLIGGSFEKAFRRAGHEVLNLKDATAAEIGRCDLVVVCLPPLMVAPWVIEHANDFADGALVTDAAGVKGVVCPQVESVAKTAKWIYVGGHPMAGKERSGYANSDADLYKGASMIFTPFAFTPSAAVEKLKAIFTEIGFARFVVTDPKNHDEMIAYTSQLAHVVSSAYVRDPLAAQHLGFSAGSFQDMTRVATVDPDIWTDLFLSNRDSLDAVLTRLIERLGQYRDAIQGENAVALKALLAEGRAAKEKSK